MVGQWPRCSSPVHIRCDCTDVHRCQEVLPLMRRARCNFAGQPDVPSIFLGVLSSLDRSSSQDQIPLTSLFHKSLLFNTLKNVEKCWKGNEALKFLGSSFCFCGGNDFLFTCLTAFGTLWAMPIQLSWSIQICCSFHPKNRMMIPILTFPVLGHSNPQKKLKKRWNLPLFL